MNILTVGPSPYLLTPQGKIQSNLLCFLKDKKHKIASAVWDHNTSYFMPDENDLKNYFEEDNNRICELFPFDNNELAAGQLLEIMKIFSPQIVITIGDYYETSFIHSIKAMYPQLFQWIAVLTIASTPIETSYYDALSYIDKAIVTSEDAFNDINKNINIDCMYHSVGVDNVLSYHYFQLDGGFHILSMAKNAQPSNIGSLIRILGEIYELYPEIQTYIHTNISDPGDYNLAELIDKYKLKNVIKLPNSYVSVQEGFSEEALFIERNKADIIVDISIRSATAMSVLESMAIGCVPLVTPTGSLFPIAVEFMPKIDHVLSEAGLFSAWVKENPFLLKTAEFIGERGEILNIPTWESISESIIKLRKLKKVRPDLFCNLMEESSRFARKVLRKDFLEAVYATIKEIKAEPCLKLAVEI